MAKNIQPEKPQENASGIAVHCAFDRLADVVELIPNPRNPNKHPDKQIALLAKVIRHQGWRAPIVVSNRSGFVVSGHGRLEAAKVLQVEKVPVDFQDFSTEADEHAHLVADNRLAELAEIDGDELAGLLSELKAQDIDMDLTGFDADSLGEALAGLVVNEVDAEPQIDKAAELQEKWKTARGQVWQLGEHRIMCGDSTVGEDIAGLMDNERARLIFTDPPYNHGSEDSAFAANVSKAHADLAASDWDSSFKIGPFLDRVPDIIDANATVYICTSWHLAGEIWAWCAGKSDHHSYCVWHKANPMPSLSKRHWTWASELICYATFGKHTFNFPKEGHASSVWTFQKKSDGTHPTQKPVDVVSHALTHSSNSGDIVFDGFSGSGTTIIACERLGRKCRAMEISPAYVAVAIQRWADATGKEPKLLNG